MPVVLRGTKAAIADVYEAHGDLVETIAKRFAYKFNQDPDETMAEANHIFLKAYHGFDRTRNSNFRARLQSVIYNRLLDWMRLNTKFRFHNRLNRVDMDLDLRSAPTTASFDREDFLEHLTNDAKTVVGIILDSPQEFKDAVLAGKPGEATERKCLLRYLKEKLGWAAKRIQESFGEIRSVLA